MNASFDFRQRSGALRCGVALVLGPCLLARGASGEKALAVDEAKPASTASGKFAFHLLPKSLQKNPELDMTVITEMTPEGATRPLVTPDEPAYYLLQPTKMMSVGEGGVGRKPVPADALQKMLQAALARNGFLAAQPPEHTPTLLLACEWGLHAGISLNQGSDAEVQKILAEAKATGGEMLRSEVAGGISHDPEMRLSLLQGNELERKNLLERAALVGGEQFAREFKRVLDQTVERTRRAQDRLIYLTNPEDSALHGFVVNDPKARHLFEQAANDVYFVVATAYDYDALQRGERHGLWRTKMTVSTDGVSMAESMPVLVRGAAPFLGRPMAEAAMLMAPLHRGAQVDIGPTQVVPDSDPVPTPAPNPERK